MNYTIPPINSYLNTTVRAPYDSLPAECLIEGNRYNAQCLNEWFCPQISGHFIKIGIILIITYIIASWALNYMMTKGYKRLPEKWHSYEYRVYWLDWIKSRFIALFLGYIVMVVWWFYK